MGKIYQVVVSTLWGRKTVIDLGNTEEQFRSMTVLQLKEKIRKRFPDIPENWRMIFADKRLDYDDRLLSSYGIQHLSVIQLVEKLSRGGCPDDLPTEENSGMGDKTGKNLSSCHYNYPQQMECSELYTIQNQKGKICQVKVFGVDGEMKVIDLCSTSAEFNRLTVKELKEKIMQEFPGISEDLCMTSVDQRMEDDDALLSSYGIQHLSAIMLVLKVRGGGGGYPDVLPTEENSGIGDKTGKNISMEKLCNFETTGQFPTQKNSELCASSGNKCTVL